MARSDPSCGDALHGSSVEREDPCIYLVPAFPAQAEPYYWREITAIERMGVRLELVSTRRPDEAPHAWSREAAQRTSYLGEWSTTGLVDLARGAVTLRLSSLRALIRLLTRSEHRGARQRLEIAYGAVMGVRLAGMARRLGAAHLGIQTCGRTAYVGVAAHHVSGLPYSLALHAPDLAYDGGDQRAKWSGAAFARLVAEWQRAAIAEFLPNRAVPMLVAPMGVELDKFRRRGPYEPWSYDAGRLRVCVIGRLDPAKGSEDSIRAISRLVERGIDVELSLAGGDQSGGRHIAAIERLVVEHGLQDRVHLLGALSEEGVRELLERSHVFCLASYAEGQSVALMEAMALGAPVVASPVGGGADVLVDRKNAMVVQPGDIEDIAAAIAEIAADPALASALSLAGREVAEERFSADRSAPAFVTLLRGGAAASG